MSVNRSRRGLISEINVVPYIDVMLVLLVIFILTAPLLTQGVVVNLPDIAADPVDAGLDEPLILSVDKTGAFYLNFGDGPDEPLDEQGLRERAAAVVRRSAATPIYVRGDEDATHGRVMRGFDLLRQAGAQQVILMFDAPEDDNGR